MAQRFVVVSDNGESWVLGGDPDDGKFTSGKEDQHALPARDLTPGPATLAVRPSRVVIGSETGIAATVSKATYVGVRMEYTLSGAFGQVFAVQDDVDDPLAPGAEVRMSFADRGPVLLPSK